MSHQCLAQGIDMQRHALLVEPPAGVWWSRHRMSLAWGRIGGFAVQDEAGRVHRSRDQNSNSIAASRVPVRVALHQPLDDLVKVTDFLLVQTNRDRDLMWSIQSNVLRNPGVDYLVNDICQCSRMHLP